MPLNRFEAISRGGACDRCPAERFRERSLVNPQNPCYRDEEKEVRNVHDYDHVWNAACLLLGVLDLRIRRLLVRRRLLEGVNPTTPGGCNVTRITLQRRLWFVLALVLCCVSLVLSGDEIDRYAQETGLDRDLIRVIDVDVAGEQLTIVFVFINERTFQSKISPTLYAALQPYIGQNAVYVNATVDDVVSQFDFRAQSIAVQQDGNTLLHDASAWAEITPGFLSGVFVTNPGGADKGSGSEGILVLGDALDASRAFSVSYLGVSSSFQIGIDTVASSPTGIAGPMASTSSHDPIEVAPLKGLDELQQVLLSEEFSQEAMAALFALDPELVRVMTLSSSGNQLRLFLVRLEATVRDSLLGGELLQAIEPVIGTGAVMVWAISSTGARFSPWHFYVQQHGTNHVFFSTASFVELTEDFLRVEVIDAGDVAAGVIRLPRGVDAAAAFAVFYGTSSVSYP